MRYTSEGVFDDGHLVCKGGSEVGIEPGLAPRGRVHHDGGGGRVVAVVGVGVAPWGTREREKTPSLHMAAAKNATPRDPLRN